MSIPGSANPLLLASTAAAGYQVSRSVRLNSADSAYFSRTPASSGNRKTWTWAGWVKRSGVAGQLLRAGTSFVSNPVVTGISFGDQINVTQYDYPTPTWGLDSVAVFRDYSAWYHVVISVDTTQATASDRVKVYVNNVLQSFTQRSGYNSAYPSQNSDTWVNSANAHELGSSFNGYLADIHFIDGQALTPSSFTEVSATTGQLIPKAYSGSFGTNGFWLKFSDNSNNTAATLGKDYSGNGHNWTPTNLSVTAGAGNDSLVDTPTSYGTDTGAGGEVRGNYATFNPLVPSVGNLVSYSDGNLQITSNGANATENVAHSTIAIPSSGKFYFEVSFSVIGAGGFGLSTYKDVSTFLAVWKVSNGDVYVTGFTNRSIGTAVAGDILGMTIDRDNNEIKFYKNNSLLTTYTSVSFPSVPIYAICYQLSSSGSCTATINFGQRPFAYTAPSGFKALCDTNLPAPTIAKPNTAMDVVLYTGTGATLTPTSSLGFNPDLVWIKSRSAATDNTLYDSVRGAQARLESNTTDAEVTSDNGLTAFNSNGFTLGTLAQVNTNTATYAGWTWDAGSSTVTNTQGSITSQVRANASAGFSIVTYTGNGVNNSSVGHGLGVAPRFVIIKNRTDAIDWIVYTTAVDGSLDYLFLNTTGGKGDALETLPSSSLFYIPGNTYAGANGKNYVAYCFAPVAGYSNGFSYTGNGSADGSFVYLGFRPRLILLKCSSTTGNWTLLDTAREGYNVDNDPLYPNLSNAEGTTDLLDITSNGFKLRTTDASVNSSGATYVGYAWAEAPLQYSRAR